MNVLCYPNDWNILKGTWNYDSNDCSVDNTNAASGNVVWFGSQDGSTPNDDYVLESFYLEVEIQVNGANGDAGILFRAQSASATNDGGQQYYIGLHPNEGVVFGKMNNGWSSLYWKSHEIEQGAIHTLAVEAIGSFYNVWIDDTQVFTNIERVEYTTGSIGLRTYNLPAKYYSVRLFEQKSFVFFCFNFCKLFLFFLVIFLFFVCDLV